MNNLQETNQKKSTDRTDEKQKKQHLFQKGQSGNPNGRPVGTGLSITTLIKTELQKCPEGQKKTYADLIVKRILKNAIEQGDDKMIGRIWAYMDGLPKQVIDHTTKGDKIENKTFVQINSMDEKTIDDEFQKKLNSQNDE